MFIDRVKVEVRAGKGGAGAVSFRREKFVPRGGPDGGNGGHGGDVLFFVDPGETTLIKLHSRPWYAAGHGQRGSKMNCTGASGDSVRLPVPPGTVVTNLETGELICELIREDQEAVVAAGGRGGRGNGCFASSINQVPTRFEPGEPGQCLTLSVELKMVADIGLVGFPNAGKSTLINSITQARARIGDYPFTTLHPVLGTLPLTPLEESELLKTLASSGNPDMPTRPRIIIADIPGILKGAHDGVGLGLEFLRHIERTQILLFVIDVSLHREYDPIEAFKALMEEVGGYDPVMLNLPKAIAFSKVDELEDEEELARLTEEFKKVVQEEGMGSTVAGFFPISAKENIGLVPLRAALVQLVMELQLAGKWRVG